MTLDTLVLVQVILNKMNARPQRSRFHTAQAFPRMAVLKFVIIKHKVFSKISLQCPYWYPRGKSSVACAKLVLNPGNSRMFWWLVAVLKCTGLST